MEISGFILKITHEYILIETYEKNQQLHIFYTTSNQEDVQKLIINQMVNLSVKLQSVEYNNEKLARCWLSFIIIPPNKVKSRNEENTSNWGQNRIYRKI